MLGLYKETWSIPDNTQIKASLQFSGGWAETVSAIGDKHIVTIYIPTQATAPFLDNLTDSQWLRISFPDGREPSWTFGLSGTRMAMRKMLDCIMHMDPTQPFGGKASSAALPDPPTQPFGGK